MTETQMRSLRVAAVLVRRQAHGDTINVSPARKSGTTGDWGPVRPKASPSPTVNRPAPTIATTVPIRDRLAFRAVGGIASGRRKSACWKPDSTGNVDALPASKKPAPEPPKPVFAIGSAEWQREQAAKENN
jgi:hypothetical protein